MGTSLTPPAQLSQCPASSPLPQQGQAFHLTCPSCLALSSSLSARPTMRNSPGGSRRTCGQPAYAWGGGEEETEDRQEVQERAPPSRLLPCGMHPPPRLPLPCHPGDSILSSSQNPKGITAAQQQPFTCLHAAVIQAVPPTE